MANHHRKYSNHVKFDLLKNAIDLIPKTPQNIKLFDIASGRGGDLFKWNNLGLRRVIGIDIDKDSVSESIQRYSKNRNRLNPNFRVSFYNMSAFESREIQNTILKKNKMDIISCMFALHYFSKTKDSLEHIIRTISSNLKKGGVFIGIAPDSKYILKLLDKDDTYDNSNIMIEMSGSNGYRFKIRDCSGNDYFAFKGMSLEYLIDKQQLIELTTKYNLYPLKLPDTQGIFPNIYDDYPEHNEKVPMSQLYFSFAFIKQ